MKEIDTHNPLKQHILKAQQALDQSLLVWQEILDDLESTPLSDESIEGKTRSLQLILQYRLDSESALARLMSMEQSLQSLGIGPQYSFPINMERLSFALGNDDLKHLLFSLNQLSETLLKTAFKQQKTLQGVKRQKSALTLSSGYKKLGRHLQKALDCQKQFLHALDHMDLELEALLKEEALGPVFDHIAALRGPISQFYQAIQHGLDYSHELYEKIQPQAQLINSITNVVQKAEEALNQISLPSLTPTLMPPIKTETSERLEERAAAKRLGHFFWH